MSASSSSTTGGGIRVRTPGIPIKCWCGERITELISKTNLNPYFWYYRCSYAAQRKLENDNHIFKWVDEAFTDERQQLDYQVRMLEEEVQVLKETIRSEGPKIISGGCLILGLSVVVVVEILM
uniref:GRF-type domain-containing protein n=1 Tax=Brassica oleracea var. oleracea TaxID=109376 RepID=A0A0D3BFV0_BRAOL